MQLSPLDRFITGELLVPVPQALTMLALWLAAAYGAGTLLMRGGKPRAAWIGFSLGLAALAWVAALLPPLWRAPFCLPPLCLVPVAGYGVFHGFRRICAVGDRAILLLMCAVFLFAVFTLGSALYPPFGWDEQVYQTALLRRYLAEGSAAVRGDNPYSAYPSLPHFALFWAAGAGGVEFPRLASWALLPLLAAAFFCELRRRHALLPSLAVTLAMVSSPFVFAAGRDFYTDLWVALFAFAGASLLIAADDGEERRASLSRFFFAGVFAGAAVAVKLPGGGAALALGVLALRSPRRLLWFLSGGAVAVLPFFARIWLATGDPVYPFGAALTGDAVAAQVAEFHRQLGRYRYGLEGIPGVAFGWIFAAFDGKLYDGIVLGWQFPLLILLALGGWGLRRRDLSPSSLRRKGDLMVVAAALCYLFWCLTSQQSRFLWPLFLAAGWGAAAALDGMSARNRRIAAGALLAAAAVSFSYPAFCHYAVAWRHCRAARRNPSAHLGAVTRDPEYFAVMEAFAELPRDARVLMIGERRTLYAPRCCRLGDPLFQGERFTPPPATAEEFASGLRGFDFLYWGHSPKKREIDHLETYDPVLAEMEAHIAELLRRGRLRMVFSIGGRHLMKILPTAESGGEIR